ncbi:MAG: HlyD family efflux transporter periplasmic adaptor subunit [Alphaproteobacteria bacterium]
MIPRFFVMMLLLSGYAYADGLSPGAVGAMGIIEPKSRVLTLTHKGTVEPVTVERLFVQEGEFVAAGQPLAQLGNHTIRKAELEEAKARIVRLNAQLRQTDVTEAFTRKEFERRQILKRQNAISASEKDETEKNWKAAVAQGAALRAEIVEAKASLDVAVQNFEDTIIRAPFAGTVLDILTRIGERASDKGIMTFANLSAMDVRAEVFESDIARIKTGQKAEIFLPQQIMPVKGVVYHIGFMVRGNDVNDTDPLADRDNRVVSVRIAVDPAVAPQLKNQIYRRVSVRFVP